MTARIVHLGLGAFHRAHQAPYTQDAGGWEIEPVAMRNPALAEVLNAQGGRYNLVERHPDGARVQPITITPRAHVLPGNHRVVAARMADSDTHFVTLTVTEKGYGADMSGRCLNRADPAVARDLATSDGMDSLAGLLCAALALRRAAGRAGLTLMSCDNLPDNGALLRALVLEMAQVRDAALADWIAATCTFPGTMVDRITPASTEATFAAAGGDRAAVETEPFRYWVIEDAFAGPRPAWEDAGALIVPDVAPYELMKLRMLNGAHSLLAYLGALAGCAAVRDVMAVPVLAGAVRTQMEAAARTLRPLPGVDYADYRDALLARFANPAIDHRCLQIAMDGSQKLPQRLFLPARDAVVQGQDISSFALGIAAWLRFLEGRSDAGDALPLSDPLADALRAAVADGSGADKLAAVSRVAGLAHHGMLSEAVFASAIVTWYDRLATQGVLASLPASA